jgi:hypothetical protein
MRAKYSTSSCTRASRAAGFTLVELTVYMIIAAIVIGFAAMTVTTPIDSYFAQARRGELSDAAESATRWISNDVHGALPGSIRVANGAAPTLEVIRVDAVEIYRHIGPGGDELSIGAGGDASFDVLQPLPALANFRVVVSDAGQSAYRADAMTDAGSATIDALDDSRVVFAPAANFPAASPNRRAYFVTTAIRYVCDLQANTLLRYDNMPITMALAPVGAAVPSIVARDVTACTFGSSLGDAVHGGLASIDMTISRAANGGNESLRIFQQIRVENAP